MKCTIQWIDCRGNPTPDENEAVGYAICGPNRYLVCKDHLATLCRKVSHHDPACKHSAHGWNWSFQPFIKSIERKGDYNFYWNIALDIHKQVLSYIGNHYSNVQVCNDPYVECLVWLYESVLDHADSLA